MPAKAHCQITVRHYECDPLGHVNHAMYVHYFEVGRLTAMADAGLPFGAVLKQGYTVVAVDIYVQYKAPAFADDVLCHLRDKLGSAPCLLVGPDISAEWERWYHHTEIDHEFGRLCLPLTHMIHGTDIRQRLRAGEAPASLSDVLPEPVAAYIAAHGLYR